MARRSVKMEIREGGLVLTFRFHISRQDRLGTPYIRGEVACISYTISR